MKWIINKVIDKYQAHGGGDYLFSVDCNYDPTCSEYFKQAVNKYGVLKGIRLGVNRIKRCNNPNKIDKNYDPLPEKLPS